MKAQNTDKLQYLSRNGDVITVDRPTAPKLTTKANGSKKRITLADQQSRIEQLEADLAAKSTTLAKYDEQKQLILREVDTAATLAYLKSHFTGKDLARELLGLTRIRFGKAYLAKIGEDRMYLWEVYFPHSYTDRKGNEKTGRRYAMLQITAAGVKFYHDELTPYTKSEVSSRRDAIARIETIIRNESDAVDFDEFVYRMKL